MVFNKFCFTPIIVDIGLRVAIAVSASEIADQCQWAT